jgi:transcriptional regulator with XRE-family HTH domain
MEKDIFEEYKIFVNTAKRVRKEKNITQEKLAVLTGVSVPTISRFENCDKDVRLSTVLTLCNALGLKIEIK